MLVFPARAAIVCLLILGTAVPAFGNDALVRARYGEAPYPIWSELSYFERSTLSDLAAARAERPDALLALFLLASGVREGSDYRDVEDHIERFLRAFRDARGESRAPRQLARELNRRMHAYFFRDEQAPTSGGPSGYDAEQSRLMGIFENGEYNCISSALLYAVLSRHFDLRTQGVLLPSHAFIQLDLPDGRAVDVETTSPHGFDQVHDEAFYERTNATWFSNRGLAPATYEDYLERERVSLTVLAARNMVNQHTAQGVMAEADAARLAEISAYIDPGNTTAQEKRLLFYNREIYSLVVDQQWPTLKRLFATTSTSVHRAASAMGDNETVQKAYVHYLGGALLTFAHLTDIERTLDLIGLIMDRTFATPERRQAAETRVINAVSVLLHNMADRALFEEGLLLMTVVEGHLSEPQAWPDMVQWFYKRWAQHHWEAREWESVSDVLGELLARLDGAESRQAPLDLLAMTYKNWVRELIRARDWDTATGVIDQCQSRFGHWDGVCGMGQKTLEQARERLSAR